MHSCKAQIVLAGQVLQEAFCVTLPAECLPILMQTMAFSLLHKFPPLPTRGLPLEVDQGGAIKHPQHIRSPSDLAHILRQIRPGRPASTGTLAGEANLDTRAYPRWTVSSPSMACGRQCVLSC